MSFILDALKKSENERQREIGPSFADVKSAAPAARIPRLWIGIGVLLLVNIIVLVVLLTRRDQASVVAMPVATSASNRTCSANTTGSSAHDSRDCRRPTSGCGGPGSGGSRRAERRGICA